MNPADVVARCDKLVSEIEMAMLEAADAPGMLERLKVERQAALAQLQLAEMRAAADAAQNGQRRETPDELWHAWQDIKFLSRSSMSARLKSRIIQRFGKANYDRMPP